MRLFSSILLTLALASCRTLPVTEIPIAKGATFDLQSPAALGQSISLEQIVDAKYGEKEFSFHCLLEVDAKQLTLVGMTPMNTRAFTLTFDGKELSVDVMPGAEMPAPPEHVLADIQLALWPEPKVRGLTVRDSGMINGETREFARGADVVIRISYDHLDSAGAFLEPWRRNIEFRHLEQEYELRIKTLRAEKLEP